MVGHVVFFCLIELTLFLPANDFMQKNKTDPKACFIWSRLGKPALHGKNTKYANKPLFYLEASITNHTSWL